MILLTQLEDVYDLKQTKWIEMNQVLNTDCGIKRIQYWDDPVLMNWHIDWRDKIGREGVMSVNRMIRTKEGERSFQLEEGWLTLHDEVTEPYSAASSEKEWGSAIGRMLSKGMESVNTDDIPFVQHSFSYDNWFEGLREEKDNQSTLMLKSLSAVKQRWQQALQIFEKVKDSPRPVTDPVHSLAQGRNLFGELYWVGGTDHPERGYRSLRSFLFEWLDQTGSESLECLFDSIDEVFCLQSDQGYLLLAECLIPWELFGTGHRTIQDDMEGFRRKWETSRELVLCLSGWLDKKRRKVTR